MVTPTAYITDVRVQAHTLSGHIENAARLNAIHTLLDRSEVAARMQQITPVEVSDEKILSVHTEEYLNLLKWSETQQGIQFGADTYALPESFRAARISCGAAVAGVDAVLSGEARNALVATRPPGHHALPDMAMGFCLLANVAIAARHAQTTFNIRKILIMDYDVHHGNGTQDIFYEDAGVLFLSSHQYPFYPGTGDLNDIGAGAGRGFTLNAPLPAGTGDHGFARLYKEVVWPLARRFAPELIIVSAGFDSHFRDPLGGLQLTTSGYAHLSRDLIRMARELCDGRIVFVQEGGYDLEALSYGMLNVAHALLGDEQVIDPHGQAPHHEPDIAPLIARLKEIHGL
ncbi:MAG: histone deacetylase [Anaerolineae bacterium]